MHRLLSAVALTITLALPAIAQAPAKTPGKMAPALAQSAFPSDADLLAMIKSRVEDGRATGIVLGVMEADGKTRVVAYGDPGPGAQPLSANSVFEIGSISKVFTSTILADIVARGEIKLEEPVQTYAPAGLTMPKRNGKEIEILNLAEQNSGLPRMPANFAPADPTNPYADYTVRQMYEFISSYTLPRDPGATFEYSNLGVGLLGHILSTHAGKTYEQLVTERVLKPLNMTMTGITLTPAMQKALVKGHSEDGKLAHNWDLPTLAGAGGLRSNMTDMLKFLAANISEPKTPLQRAMRDAQKPRTSAGGAMQIGLNWLTIKAKAGDITWHNGATGGYGSFIGFDQKRHIGVVMLANRTAAPEDIAMHLLDPSIPLAAKPEPPKPHTAIDLPAETLAKYVGVYALDAAPTAFKLAITQEPSGLFVQATGQGKFPIFPEAEAKFFARIADAQMTFFPAADGKPAYMVLHQNGADQRATKLP